jgi:hypothetical protein
MQTSYYAIQPMRFDHLNTCSIKQQLYSPNDGELCPSRTKPEETLVEVRSDSDVQIDRQTWVLT